MHGWIAASFEHMFENQLLIGQVYEISNFGVVSFTKRFKCFEGSHQIIITGSTKIQSLEANSLCIPKNDFHFTDLHNFEPPNEEGSHLLGKYIFHTTNWIVFKRISFQLY